eukprot:Partr_v1_DN27457_c2_g1_i1_m71961 putative hydroxymethylglutaryl-CoA reductase, degradative family protein
MNKELIAASWSGFHRKPIRERQSQLQLQFPHVFRPSSPSSTPASPLLTPRASNSVNNGGDMTSGSGVFPIHSLADYIADNMIENCIGTLGVPVGIAPNFIVNGRHVVVPMATEEPSVVAACNSAAKSICASSGGFVASCSSMRNTIQAQMLITSGNSSDIMERFEGCKSDIIQAANSYCSSMVARGGGVVDAFVRSVTKWTVIHLVVDVCESMGANCVNTVAEGVSPFIEQILGVAIGPCIVSNLNDLRVTTASFSVPVANMAYKGVSGVEMARRMVEIYEWARDDPYRAVTHNKGIMNGVDAVCLATGQDFRAVEAACHAYAVRDGQYRSLSRYWVEKSAEGFDVFCGELSIPFLGGTIGGAIRSNPVYQYTLGLAGNPQSMELANIIVSAGLAQNFAAMRALVSTGIQAGHMSLHARNIAIAAGTPTLYISEVADYLVKSGHINLEAAHEYLCARDILMKIGRKPATKGQEVIPSILMFEDEDQVNPMRLNIAFSHLGDKPLFIRLNRTVMDDTTRLIFGHKTYEWLMTTLGLLSTISPFRDHQSGSTAVIQLQKKLRAMAVLSHVVLRQLLLHLPDETDALISSILKMQKRNSISHATNLLPLLKRFESSILGNNTVDTEKCNAFVAGACLFVSLWQTFEFHVLQWVPLKSLQHALLLQHIQIIQDVKKSFLDSELSHVRSFIGYSRRYQVEIFLLISAIACDEKLLTPAFLEWLQSAGQYLDIIVAVAHDLARSGSSSNADNLYTKLFSNMRPSEFKRAVLEDQMVANIKIHVDEYVNDTVMRHIVDPEFLTKTCEAIENWYNVIVS